MILENGEYVIDGSSYQGKAPTDYLLGTWWNHSIVKAESANQCGIWKNY